MLIIFDRGEIRLRAQEISARTITVHGDTSENILGPSQYNEALHRLGLYRGSNSQYVPGQAPVHFHHHGMLLCLANAKKVSSTSAFSPRELYAELRVLHPGSKYY